MPFQTVGEYLREVSLSRRKHVVVEGSSDRRTWEVWADRHALGNQLTFHEVAELHVPYELLVSNSLGAGRRAEVLGVALEATAQGIDMKCIADRDTGELVHELTLPVLLWTDYPALESYSFCPKVIDAANRLNFRERLPKGEAVVALLSGPMAELFARRCENVNLRNPNFARGVTSVANGFSFDATVATGVTLIDSTRVDSLLCGSDARGWAHGHDISALIFFAFQGEFSGSGTSGVKGVEAALVAAMHSSGELDESPLARRLAGWIKKI
ncbi:hypothetical protein EDD41_3263 [Luteococcus japonicus]|uniref:DUF4435 domain-containing protein n=2 Tax=Luteococcus japonicus TaxID=33984 RepID=A0A3N1ZYP1_9ACTN|nr:hypothetical protein EDD41_3263 [Luteococcus japonicus]